MSEAHRLEQAANRARCKKALGFYVDLWPAQDSPTRFVFVGPEYVEIVEMHFRFMRDAVEVIGYLIATRDFPMLGMDAGAYIGMVQEELLQRGFTQHEDLTWAPPQKSPPLKT